jgi:hypothetical protein
MRRLTLAPGGEVFWPGETVAAAEFLTDEDSDGVPVRNTGYPFVSNTGEWYSGPANGRAVPAPFCGLQNFPCFDYELELTGPGARLRVAVDNPTVSQFGLEVYGPDGAFLTGYAHNYTTEVFVPEPETGVYRVRVVVWEVRPASVIGVDEVTFRMRAKLERAAPASGAARALLPNLRTRFDHDFHFGECDDEATAAATIVPGSRCLRFGSWFDNAGAGPLDVRLTPAVATGLAQSPAYQRVHYSDGSVVEREAGTHDPLPHVAHAHYHLRSMIRFELFRVEAETLVAQGAGNKIGFCPGDFRVTGWHRFYQDRVDDTFIADRQGTNCGLDQSDPVLALTTGWSDHYGSGLAGQMMQIPAQDGEYVLRATIDPAGNIAETDDMDNAGYAYLRAAGDSVEVLERGLGSSPWAAGKVVLDPYWD